MEVKVKFNEIKVKEEKEQTLVKVLMLKGDPGSPGATDYNDLLNKPTKLSDFVNDGVFITDADANLVNYYKKSETYTQSETNNLIENKVDKVTGKGLSTEDYTTAEKTKLSNIETEANKTTVVQGTGSSTTSVMSQDAVTTQLNTKATTSLYTSTLSSSNWSSTAPYTQTVNVSGILSTDTPIVDVVLSSTTSTAISEMEAWNCVSKIETSNGSITATCLESKPEISLNVQLKVVR